MKETWKILNEIMGGKGKETTADINLDECNLGDSIEIRGAIWGGQVWANAHPRFSRGPKLPPQRALCRP